MSVSNSVSTECWVCGVVDAKRTCGGCKSTLYCSEKCQRRAWIAHKTVCKNVPVELAKAVFKCSGRRVGVQFMPDKGGGRGLVVMAPSGIRKGDKVLEDGAAVVFNKYDVGHLCELPELVPGFNDLCATVTIGMPPKERALGGLYFPTGFCSSVITQLWAYTQRKYMVVPSAPGFFSPKALGAMLQTALGAVPKHSLLSKVLAVLTLEDGVEQMTKDASLCKAIHDFARLQSVVASNSVAIVVSEDDPEKKDLLEDLCALSGPIALINHGQVNKNAQLSFFGHGTHLGMVVHATRAILQGEEILMPYLPFPGNSDEDVGTYLTQMAKWGIDTKAEFSEAISHVSADDSADKSTLDEVQAKCGRTASALLQEYVTMGMKVALEAKALYS